MNFEEFVILLKNPAAKLYSIPELTQIRDNLLHELDYQSRLNKIFSTVTYQAINNDNNENKKIKVQQINSEPQINLKIQHQSSQDSESQYNKVSSQIKKTYVSRYAKNDTKNIPKNFGKSILNFIYKSPITRRIAEQIGIPVTQVLIVVRGIKKKINTIKGLRQMWASQQIDSKITKCIRILSHHYMRKYALRYIFKSRVRNYTAHIKYKRKIMQGIQNPQNFLCIKDY